MKLINNTGSYGILVVSDRSTTLVTVTHSGFLDNAAGSLIYLDGDVITVSLSEFINNRASVAVVNIPFYSTSESISNNVFHHNSAGYKV